MNARKTGLLLGALTFGCNSILGIEPRELVAPDDGVAGTFSESGGTTGGDVPVGAAGASSGTGTSAGTLAAGGTAGSPSGGTSGASGGPPDFMLEGELAEALSELDGYRFENTCGYLDSPGACVKGSLCYPNSLKQVWSYGHEIGIGGDASHVYEVELRVRGVLEPHVYPPNCGILVLPPSGKTIGIVEDCDGFENKQDAFNTFRLTVRAPLHEYFLNAVPRDSSYRVEAVDLRWTTKIQGQSKVSFDFADEAQAGQVRNCSEVVPDVPPAPDTFDGQFLQLNVTAAAILP